MFQCELVIIDVPVSAVSPSQGSPCYFEVSLDLLQPVVRLGWHGVVIETATGGGNHENGTKTSFGRSPQIPLYLSQTTTYMWNLYQYKTLSYSPSKVTVIPLNNPGWLPKGTRAAVLSHRKWGIFFLLYLLLWKSWRNHQKPLPHCPNNLHHGQLLF